MEKYSITLATPGTQELLCLRSIHFKRKQNNFPVEN
jgi:hypothetical protein